MNIIYILTSLALIISYLLLNKSEKKENLIHSVIISVILFLTYNIFITQNKGIFWEFSYDGIL